MTNVPVVSPLGTPTEHDNLKGVDRLRQKFRPALLYVVSLVEFINIVNGSSVAVAILPIAQDLKFSVTEVLWIINAYTITFAGLLLFSGRLGDLIGHRRMFMFGLFWFALWALVVSFSTFPIMFILSRALQGMGAASTIPTAMALIATNYPAGPERTKALSIYGAFGGLGAVTGLLLAGGLIASLGWQWIFRISAIAAFVLLVLSYFTIPLTPPKDEKPKVDFLGAITATLGVTGIVYYIATGVDYGWGSAKTIPIFVVALVLIGSFVLIESRVQTPLMPLRVWKVKSFTTSVVLAFVSMAKSQGSIYYANMVFQEVYQWNALQTALGFLVHALLAIVVFGALGRILPRMPLKPLIMAGFLLRCVTALMFSFVTEHTSYFALPFPAFIIHIFGIGLSHLPIQITAVRDAENEDQGLVGALYNTGLQLGAPFGIAILNVIVISTNGNAGADSVRGGPALMKGFRNAFYAMVAMGLFGFFLALVILPWDKPVRPAMKKNYKEEAELAELERGLNELGRINGAPGDGEKDVVLGVEESAVATGACESDASTICSIDKLGKLRIDFEQHII
ncbi:MFS general substrate transporter [Linnemannia elongata AG-77]|uniref:MFS general substrate transporter n=1 Tax=Linnemannia elongata AG-77 TaxID=1314771 RepID=A0A197JDU2_9FUNG|nr:MFS general substrate transporter [Linnemannia elongata AG-77]